MPQGKKSHSSGMNEATAMRLYFDGRSADKQGSGGFIAFSQEGNVLAGPAYNYGREAGTVNAAELESLKRALEWLVKHEVQAPHVVIYGDSDLTVRFINR